MGDTGVYPISNTKENRQVVTVWNGEVKRFQQRTKPVHLRWEEVPEARGVKGYLGIWVGLSSGEGGQADYLSEELSVKAETGIEGEEDLGLEKWEEHINVDSQGMSSGYAEETVASISHRRKASSQHEIELPISCAFRMMVTRRKVRELKREERGVEEKGGDKWKEDQKRAGEGNCEESEERGGTQEKAGSRPGQLVVLIVRGNISQYINGYLQDPAFEEHWKASPLTADELIATHQYYKDKDSLLFFWTPNCKAPLSIPHPLS